MKTLTVRIVALTLFLTSSPILGQAHTLEGYVRDGLTGLPVGGAAVGFGFPMPGGSISDATGHYVIAGIPFSGPLTVTAWVPGNPAYAVTTRNVNLPSGPDETIYRDFTLFPKTPIVVSTVDDAGAGSLLQAIAAANADSGMSYIMFDIPVSPPTIQPTPGRLLSVTEAIWIDATTQPETGYVEIDGTNAGTGANGLVVLGNRCTIRGMVINRFSGYGIQLFGCNYAVIEGCRIGTDPGGTIARGNEGGGIFLWGTSLSHIGGPSVAARNVIAANGSTAITPGIYVYDNSNGNHIEGNFIGVTSDGMTALGNRANGVWVNDSRDNVIGGNSPFMGNLIAGNSSDGVHILDQTSTGNRVIGNLIGTNVDGTSALGNGGAGVRLNDAPDNVVGGSSAGERNVISGNVLGVVIQGPAGASHATGNIVIGNYIGTNKGGIGAIPNTEHGIFMGDCSGNRIGGANSGERNIISGNTSFGVLLMDNASANRFLGNYIGTDYTGTTALPNFIGVHVLRAKDNFIGGHSAGEGNLISGNRSEGILIYGDIPGGATEPVYATGNVIEGNLIGTSASGQEPLGNQANGIRIDTYSRGNFIGGTLAGSRNVISGNGASGIVITTATASQNTVWGTFIGTNVGGGIDMGNSATGISIDNGAFNNTVGGTSAAMRNVISGNQDGIRIIGPGTTGNLLKGNYVGTDATGTIAIGNHNRGIAVEFALNNVIGGGEVGAGNVVSANANVGINLDAASRNIVQGNIIGLNAPGTSSIGHQFAGIWLGNNPGSSDNSIGGTNASERNIISGNAAYGIGLMGAHGNTIIGNFVGVEVSGTVARGNGYDHPGGSGFGILLLESYDNRIGGATGGSANVVAGNIGSGISIMGEQSFANDIRGNRIGTDVTGNLSLGNTRHGIHLGYSVNDPSIGPPGSTGVGGRNVGDGNIIAYNGGDGVSVEGGMNHSILSNSIYANGALGIDLGRRGSSFDGVTLNDPLDADTGPNGLQNFPVIEYAAQGTGYVRGTVASTPDNILEIQFFANAFADSSGYGEGQVYVGSQWVMTDALGNANFAFFVPATFSAGQILSATATDSMRNTSEFSKAYVVPTSGVFQPPVGYAAEQYATGLIEPQGMTLDGNGNLVVAVRGSREVVRYDAAGTKTVLATNFMTPVDVAVDWNNRLYVADIGGNCIYVIDLNAGGFPVNATLLTPHVSGLPGPGGLKIGADRWLYISCAGAPSAAKVVKVDLTSAPSPANVITFPAIVGYGPEGIAFAGNGDLYLSLRLQGQVRLMTEGTSPGVDGTRLPVALAGLDNPTGIDIGLDGKIYVATSDKVVNSRPNSQTYTTFLTGLSGGQFNDVLCADNGYIYVSDVAGGRIIRVMAPRQQKLPGTSLAYVISQDGDPLVTDGSDITAIRNGFRHWQDVPTTSLTFTGGALTPQKIAAAGDGVNLVTFQDAEFYFPPFVLAVTAKTLQVGASGNEGTIVDADILFNPAYSNTTAYSFGTNTKTGQYDIESIVTHESGHAAGLVHSGVPGACMFFVLQPGTGARTLKHDDQAWISYLYPNGVYNSTYGSVAGRVEDGYNPGTGVAGALVLASSVTTSDTVHAYTDREGNYVVPGLAPGNYRVYIHPLDGDVFGYPLTAGYVSAYLQTLTKITDFPAEFFNSTNESADPAIDNPTAFSAVPVAAGTVTSNVNLVTNQDKTPPTVVSVFPASAATNADVAGEILVTFSEPINKNTVSLSTVSLTIQSTGAAVQGSFLSMNNSTLVVFTPLVPLAYGTTYRLEVKTGITDLKGNSLVAPFSSTFTTRVADTTPPTVEQIVPANGVDSVFITTSVTVVFSESIQPQSVETGTPPGFVMRGPGGAIQGTFTYEQGTRVVTFKPSTSLAEGTAYTITLTGIKDLPGNVMVSGVTNTFTTIPQAAPQILTIGPYHGETGVTVTTPVLVDFSEPVNPFTITNASFQLVGPSGQIAGSFDSLQNNSRVVFRPYTDLAYNTTYTITITTAVEDLSTPVQHLDAPWSSNFTTTIKPSAPQIFNIYPPAAIVGADVTINGQGFDPTPQKNSVVFDTVGALVTIADLHSLAMAVPKGAGSGPVTVTVGGVKSAPYQFTVIEVDSNPANQVVASVATSKGTRSGDITPDGAYAYVANAGTNTVSVIDLGSRVVVGAAIPVGSAPMKIAINPGGTYAYVTNYNSNSVSVIDVKPGSPTWNKVVMTIPVGINPIGVCVTPDGGRIYVAELTSKSISVIDGDPNSGAFNRVVAKVTTTSGNRSADVNPDGTLAFFTGTEGLTILDISPASAAYNRVVAKVNSSTGTRDVAVTPDGALAVVTTMGAEIWIVDVSQKGPGFGNVVAKVTASSGIRDVEIRPDGTLVYVTNYDDNSVSVYKFATTVGPGEPDFNPVVSTAITLTRTATIQVGSNPEGLVFDPKARVLVVANAGSDNVSIINVLSQVGNCVALATNSVKLDTSVVVHSGNIVVNEGKPGSKLVSGFELSVGMKASIGAGSAVRANRIQVLQQATVAGPVQFNTLVNRGTITGALTPALPLPVYGNLPPFVMQTPGNTDVIVQKNQTKTLGPNNYRDLFVQLGGKLVLTGGVYNVRNVLLETSTTLHVKGPTEMRVQQRFATNNKSTVGPAPGTAIAASSIIIYVAGTNGKSGKLDERPSAVDIGPNNTVLANWYAPNGCIRFGPNAVATGSFIASDILFGTADVIRCDSYFMKSGSTLGKFESNDDLEAGLPVDFALAQNYPNPFNPSTTIAFDIPTSMTSGVRVTLMVFNILGQVVKELVNEEMSPGQYSIVWDGTNDNGQIVASGVYLCRFVAGDFAKTNKMMLLK